MGLLLALRAEQESLVGNLRSPSKLKKPAPNPNGRDSEPMDPGSGTHLILVRQITQASIPSTDKGSRFPGAEWLGSLPGARAMADRSAARL